MRNPALLIFANALILVAAFAMLSQFLFAAPLAAVTTRVQGNVALQQGGHGNFVALSEGNAIRSGDVIRCDEKASAELAWPEGGHLKVMPATEMRVKKLHRGTYREWHASLFSIKTGRVAVHLDRAPSPNASLQIQTPTALATAHSTDFVVDVQNGQTQVKVDEGSVEVESQGNRRKSYRLVTAKQSVTSCFPGELQSTDSQYSQLINDPWASGGVAGPGTPRQIESLIKPPSPAR